MFFLLCRYTDDGVFDDFLKISDFFPKIFEDSSQIVCAHAICLSTKWLNIPPLKLGNVRMIFLNFQNCACYKKKNRWRVINTVAFIWCENMLGYLSKLTVFKFVSSEYCSTYEKNWLPVSVTEWVKSSIFLLSIEFARGQNARKTLHTGRLAVQTRWETSFRER